MDRKLPTEAQCKRASAVFERVVPRVFEYARRKHYIDRPFDAYHDLSDEWKDFPEDFESNVLGMLAGDAVCGSPKRCAGLVRAVKDKVPDDQLALMRGWRKVPWVWTILELHEDVGSSIVATKPVGDPPQEWPEDINWNELLVYSPTMTRELHSGTRLAFAQLVYMDGAFHSSGFMMFFPAFSKTDFLAFADMLRATYVYQRTGAIEPLAGIPGRTTVVSDLIRSEPFAFLQLLPFTEMPRITGREGDWRVCRSVALAGGSGDLAAVDFWRDAVSAAGHEVNDHAVTDEDRAFYLDGGTLYDPIIYVNVPDRRIFLHAATERAYAAGREALSRVVEMPAEPMATYSMIIATAADRILGDVDEIGLLQRELSEPLEERQDELSDEEGLKEANAVVQRLVHDHNEGIQETDAEIAADLDVPEDMVAQLRASLLAAPGLEDRAQPSGGDEDGARSRSRHGPRDTLGLAPRPLRDLTRGGVPDAPGALSLRSPDELRAAATASALEAVPLVRFARWLLVHVADRTAVPATAAGYVKPSIVMRAIDERAVYTPREQARRILEGDGESEPSDEAIDRTAGHLAPKKESDWKPFLRKREILEAADLIRLDGKQFRVTEEARRLLSDTTALYHELVVTMFERYEWDYHERLPVIPGLRDHAGFLLYALHKLATDAAGDDETYGWVGTDALLHAYLGLHPGAAEEVELATTAGFGDHYLRYLSSTIDQTVGVQLGATLGLVERDTDDDRQDRLRPTSLFPAVFEVGS